MWLTTFKRNIEESTRVTYHYNYDRMKECLGWRKLSKLGIIEIQECFNNMVSDDARKKSKTTLNDMLDKAVLSGKLKSNPAKTLVIKIDGDEKEEKRIFSVREEKLVLDYCKNHSIYYNLIAFMLVTGLRIGEATGLTWKQVDFNKKCLYVKDSNSKVSGYKGESVKYVMKSTKTKKSVRTIPITNNAMTILREQKELFANLTLDEQSNLDRVFISSVKKPVNYSTFRSHLERMCKGIQRENPNFENFTSHALRHTFATRCIEGEMNPKTLQKILGHSTLAQTMDTYVHVTEDNLFKEMSKFENYMKSCESNSKIIEFPRTA